MADPDHPRALLHRLTPKHGRSHVVYERTDSTTCGARLVLRVGFMSSDPDESTDPDYSDLGLFPEMRDSTATDAMGVSVWRAAKGTDAEDILRLAVCDLWRSRELHLAAAVKAELELSARKAVDALTAPVADVAEVRCAVCFGSRVPGKVQAHWGALPIDHVTCTACNGTQRPRTASAGIRDGEDLENAVRAARRDPTSPPPVVRDEELPF